MHDGSSRAGPSRIVRVRMLKRMGEYREGEIVNVPVTLAELWEQQGAAKRLDWPSGVVVK